MWQSASGWIKEGNRDVPKSAPCADSSDTSNAVDGYIVEVAEIDNQVTICATKTVCSVGVTPGTRGHCDLCVYY